MLPRLPIALPHRLRNLAARSALLAALLLTACGPGVQLTGDVSAGPATGDAIAIEAADNLFRPADVALAAGAPAVVEITNTGIRPHDWTVDDLGLSTGVMAPGETYTARFTAPDEPVEFVCTLHPGMKGLLEVG